MTDTLSNALGEQIRTLATLASEEMLQTRTTLQIILDLERAILSKMGFSVAEIDQMCTLSRVRAKTLHEQELSTRWRALLAPESKVEPTPLT